MAPTIDTKKTCEQCGFFDPAFNHCRKANTETRAIFYACREYKSREQLMAEAEQRRQERLKKEEQRLNFILTGLYIQSTAVMQLLEHFDAQFTDRKAESDWRFSRKRAANEISRCVQRIRDVYQHTFMVDQTEVMTDHGRQAFDFRAYDNHEDDARRWNKLLLHHMETSWQDESKEAEILNFYEGLPHVGIFRPQDFNHFTTKH